MKYIYSLIIALFTVVGGFAGIAAYLAEVKKSKTTCDAQKQQKHRVLSIVLVCIFSLVLWFICLPQSFDFLDRLFQPLTASVIQASTMTKILVVFLYSILGVLSILFITAIFLDQLPKLIGWKTIFFILLYSLPISIWIGSRILEKITFESLVVAIMILGNILTNYLLLLILPKIVNKSNNSNSNV